MKRACAAHRRTPILMGRGTALGLDSPSYLALVGHCSECESCSDWLWARRVQGMGGTVTGFPCVHMAWYAQARCEKHVNRWRCPDATVVYSPKFNEYALPLNSHAGLTIRFCPWCGTELPPSVRDRWFADLEAIGLSDPWGNDRRRVPSSYRTSEWWQAELRRASRRTRGAKRRRTRS